jgi:hypothetical protein
MSTSQANDVPRTLQAIVLREKATKNYDLSIFGFMHEFLDKSNHQHDIH